MGSTARLFAPYPERNGSLLTFEGVFFNVIVMLGAPIFLLTRFFPRFATEGVTVGNVTQAFVLMLFFIFGILQFFIFVLDRTSNSLIRRQSIEAQGLGNSWSNALKSFVIGAVLMGAFLVIFKAVNGSVASLVGSAVPFAVNFSDATTSALYVKVFSPIFEEYFFRGALFPSLNANLSIGNGIMPDVGSVASIFVVSLFFMLVHQEFSIFRFLLSAVFIVLQYQTKSIGAPLGAHLVLNAVVG